MRVTFGPYIITGATGDVPVDLKIWQTSDNRTMIGPDYCGSCCDYLLFPAFCELLAAVADKGML